MKNSCYKLLTLCIATFVGVATAQESSTDLEGFVEPYRSIDVSSAETGRVESIEVVIGQRVRKGDPVALLDSELQEALVEIAEQQAEASGAIEAAKADRGIHETRIKHLEKLTKGGYARPEELMRAVSDRAVANARVQQALENQKISEAELVRYRIQLQRRTVRAPVDGVISALVRDPGEFVSPTEPYVVRMIQVDPLVAVFNIPASATFSNKQGSKVLVRIGSSSLPQKGIVDSISPQIDAESGTTRVRIRIPNNEGELTAGVKCWLSVPLRKIDLEQASLPTREYLNPIR